MIRYRPRLLATLRSLSILLAVSTASPTESPLEQAVALAKQKNYQAAQQVLNDVPEPSLIAQRIAFHRLKAAIASGLGQPLSAVGEMRKALELAPDNSELLLATAISEMQAELFTDALQHTKAANHTAAANALTGDIQDRLRNVKAATAAYQNAVLLAPENDDYQIALGSHLIRNKEFGPAVESLKHAHLEFPKSGRLGALLGVAYYATGETLDAIRILEKAIADEPAVEASYRCLARIVLESSTIPSAETTRDLCAWDEIVCAAVQLRMAHAHSDARAERVAIAKLQQAPQDNVTAHCELGRAYEWISKLSEARTEMEACVRHESSPQNHYRLALIYRRLGMTERANTELALRQQLQESTEQSAAGLDAYRALQSATK